MEVDDSNSGSGDGAHSLTPAQQLKTRLSASGDSDTPLCNGDAKKVNGQNGNHDEEAMDTTDDVNGRSKSKETEEDETDSKDNGSKEEEGGESDGESSETKTNGKDSASSKSKDKTDPKDDVTNVDDDSKDSDNKENTSVKSDGTKSKVEEDDSSQDVKSVDPEKSEEDSKDGSSKPQSPSESKKESSPSINASEKSASVTPTPSEEDLKRAADVDQREKKLKRIEDAAKDNDDLRPVAKLLYGIGMDLGAQHIYKDLVRAQSKKLSQNKLDGRGQTQLSKLKDTYKKLCSRNEAYQLKIRSCEKCGFKTESKNVIQWHLEFAHGQDLGKYECSFCDFETRLPAPFFFHMEAEHNRKGRVFMKKAFFSCPQCPYENNSKTAVTRHRLKCDKQFSLKRNQEPLPTDCDIPLKKPKSIVTKRVGPLPKPINPSSNAHLKTYLDHRGNQQSPNIRPMTSVVRVNHPNPTVQTILSQQNRQQFMNQRMAPNPQARILAQQRPQIQGPGGQMYTLVNSLMVQQLPQAAYTTILPQVRPQLQQQQQAGAQYAPPAQNISQIAQQVVAQVTQQHNAAQQQKAIQDILKRAQQVPSSSPGTPPPSRPNTQMTDAQAQAAAASNPKFEICEICGGFVKDRESLRIHFYWAHKVDIQKDVFARLNPHLKCENCTQCFWTYQGLARHRQISHVQPRGRSYRCYLCGAKNIENIITHLSAAHNVKLNTMYKTGKCLVCGLGFAGEKGLKRHIHTAHLELLKGQPDMATPTRPPHPVSGPVPTKPLSAIKPNSATKPGNPVPTGLFENAAKKKKFEPVCSLCNIVFPSVESFTLHCNKLHVFKCWRCSDKWASSDLLHKHWFEKHRHDIDQCSLCTEKITIGRPFIRHMKRSHLKDCSVVLVRMSPKKVKYYQDRLEELATTMKKDKKDEVIILDDDDEEEPKKSEEEPKKSDEEPKKSDGDESEAVPAKSSPPPSRPMLKSGDEEVMEVDGEKIVVQVSQDEDDEPAENDKDEDDKDENDKDENDKDENAKDENEKDESEKAEQDS